MKLSKRTLASRANGALSKGPKTPEGKKRSSINGLRHGLLSDLVVLDGESKELFAALLAQFVARFDPRDDVEFNYVEDMVASIWRKRRAWAIENCMLSTAAANRPESDFLRRLAAGFTTLAEGRGPALLLRYESRACGAHQRALDNFFLLHGPLTDPGEVPEQETSETVQPQQPDDNPLPDPPAPQDDLTAEAPGHAAENVNFRPNLDSDNPSTINQVGPASPPPENAPVPPATQPSLGPETVCVVIDGQPVTLEIDRTRAVRLTTPLRLLALVLFLFSFFTLLPRAGTAAQLQPPRESWPYSELTSN